MPPTHKGPSLKFAYELVVGICRGGPSDSVSRVMKVPIRIYNNVTVGRAPRPYDLLWPLARRRNPKLVPTPSADEIVPSLGPHRAAVNPTAVGSFLDLQEYGRRLLAPLDESKRNGDVQDLSMSTGIDDDLGREEEGSLTGCREAVEILTRNPKKGKRFSVIR